MEGYGGPLARRLEAVGSCLESEGVASREVFLRLVDKTPREEYGDYGFPLMRFAGGRDLEGVLSKVKDCVEALGVNGVSLSIHRGFLNLKFNEDIIGGEAISLYEKGWRVDVIKVGGAEAKNIVVEHTSANPVHPLHIGHARNASLGDTLARMLEARGHRVVRRYYVNDVGRQTAIVVYGFKILNTTPRDVAATLKTKVDHAIGWVYALTHTAVDFALARKNMIEEDLNLLASTLARLRERGSPELADKIIGAVLSLEDPEAEVSKIMLRYEMGLEPEKSLVRSIAEAALEGFRETLEKLGVEFDHWDWESDIVWSGLLAGVLNELSRSGFTKVHKGTVALDTAAVIRDVVEGDSVLRESIKLPRGFEVPPMVLYRSDGTTLYWTRDIAYSIYKFQHSKADRVINVVAVEQKLPQLQIRLALAAIGRVREAANMIHYEYEMVNLPGRAMSGRRGEYVTLDELLEEAEARAFYEVKARNPDLEEETARNIARKVAAGAIRFSLVQPGALKPLTFDTAKVLNFEENTGPYLQYTHARASNILEKHGPIKYELANPKTYSEPLRRNILITALAYPMISAKAADELRPEDLAAYLLKLADIFNKWYQKDSVIHEKDPGAREAKATLVKLVKDTLSSGLTLLGVTPLERM